MEDVFTAYGWIEVWDEDRQDEFGDRENSPVPATVEAVTAVVERASYAMALRPLNGIVTVQIAVRHNHRGDYVMAAFNRIGELAPGSFGALDTSDDESPQPQEWRRYVMVRGSVRVEVDTGLSPRVRKLEDD